MRLLRTVLPLVMIVSCLSVLPGGWMAQAAGSDPIRLEGEYLVQTPENVYTDHVQPGDSPSYTLVIENEFIYETTFRATVSNVPSGWLAFFDNGQGTVVVSIPAAGEVRQNLNVKAPTSGTGRLIVNVSVEGGMQWWPMDLHITASVGPLQLTVPGSSFVLGREDPVNVPFTVKNVGAAAVNVTFSMGSIITSDEPIQDKWTVRFSQRQVSVQPGASIDAIATVRCPKDEPINSQKLSSISATAQGIERPFVSKTLTFKVETIFDLRTTVSPSGYEKVARGMSKEFTVLIENWASATDHVIIEPDEIPSGWTVSFNDIIDPYEIKFTVTPGEKRPLHPVVYVSPNAQAGKREVVLKAVGDKNVTQFALKVQVEREEGLEARQTATGGVYPLTLGPNVLSFSLVNIGNFYDDVEVSIQSAPGWLTARFVGLRVGGDVPLDVPQPDVNISEMTNRSITFPGSDRMTVHFRAFQSSSVRLAVNVPMGTEAQPEAKIGLKFVYGGSETVRELYLSVKLILVDLEIVDSDSDGLPNLNIWPPRSRSHYMVGDELHFTFGIENRYPYATSGVGYSIELIGVEVVSGDLGEIAPGETRSYNITWKIGKSTEGAYPFRMKLTGPAFPVGVDPPTAKTKEEVSIGGGEVERPIGLIIAFILFMSAMIAVFLVLVYFAKRNKAAREEKELAEYERVYGRRPGVRRGSLDKGPKGREVPPARKLDRVGAQREMGRLGPARSHERPEARHGRAPPKGIERGRPAQGRAPKRPPQEKRKPSKADREPPRRGERSSREDERPTKRSSNKKRSTRRGEGLTEFEEL